ncbi:MAG: hypothetical protein Q8P39_00160 [Candidatus Yanofskybacteria bacterium]|nr:hypothetical protein [Candidatus Yanofskybacteria bacterium]
MLDQVAMPAEGAEFPLGFCDSSSPPFLFAGFSSRGWRYVGPPPSQRRVIKAKLVRLGSARDLREARQIADEMDYSLVSDRAQEPFTALFPRPAQKGLVIFGGSEWENALGRLFVVCIRVSEGAWNLFLRPSDELFGEFCLWMAGKKEGT